MNEVAWFRPHQLEEALALLEQYGEEARPVAGGSALALLLKQRLVQPRALIGLAGLTELRGIRQEPDGLHLGALTTHAEVERLAGAAGVPPLLVETYRRVATRRVRNQATVGGGLAHADPAQDPPAALLALEARVRLVGPRGERIVPLDQFFVDYYETVLQPGELIREVIVPPQPSGSAGAYVKFLSRSVDDYATVAVAVQLGLEGRVLTGVRVAFIAAGPTPRRAREVEALLEGEVPRVGLLQEAGQLASQVVEPLDDSRGSAAYKREMAGVMLERAVRLAVERARSGQ